MLFNSYTFLLYFFPIVTTLYFALPHPWRWLLLLLASGYFYMYLIPVYILILIFTIVVDYFAGLAIERAAGRRRKLYLIASVIANVGVLFAFKYFNFFNANVAALAHALHWNYSLKALAIILPIGLSFHTFQSMAYTIEVYRGAFKAERHFGIYALYVMFYPQLVAGPIERPHHLLPQFYQRHVLDAQRVASGLQLMLWGLFKKMVIADRLAVIVNQVYAEPTQYGGLSLLAATYAFAYQIYCDFSGYSDIARGSAQVMGFTLIGNFERPYFAQSIAEFWRRWHISLSTWFKDYLYIPLGGNRVPTPRRYANLLAVFLVSGIWHGANWTFVVWGALHGLYLVFGLATAHARQAAAARLGLNRLPRLQAAVRILVTFHLTLFAWIFFRAATLSDGLYIVTHLFGPSGWPTDFRGLHHLLPYLGTTPYNVALVAAAAFFLELVQIKQERGPVRPWLASQPTWVRWPVYYLAALSISLLGRFDAQEFIYFQF